MSIEGDYAKDFEGVDTRTYPHDFDPDARRCKSCGIHERLIRANPDYAPICRGPHLQEQAPPVPSGGEDCWLLVMKDMEERRQHWVEKYGQPVMPFNGRDPLVDAYQEALDLTVYLRQAIEERKNAKGQTDQQAGK